MKEKLMYAGRLLFAVVVLALGVFGYVFYEKTLVAWWYPVMASAALSFIFLPLLGSRWRWLTRTESAFLNVLCHFYVVGLLSYFLLLAGNYCLADSQSAREEEALVLKKEKRTRTVTQRSGRRYRNISRKVDEYYVTVRFSDGTCKELHVQLSLYNRTREDKPYMFTVRKGLLGFRVVF